MIVHCICSMCPIVKVKSNVKVLNQSVGPESAGLNQSVSPESAGLDQSVSQSVQSRRVLISQSVQSRRVLISQSSQSSPESVVRSSRGWISTVPFQFQSSQSRSPQMVPPLVRLAPVRPRSGPGPQTEGLNKRSRPYAKETSGAFGAPGGKMPKVSLHRVGSSGVFLHRVGNSTILAPFRP
jgi:hypothetical protein